MGEYAMYRGESVKIGTCEDMYYLRHDQRHQVTAESGNVDPVRDASALRFRFPWPDEDRTLPGHFDGAYDRSLAIHGVASPDGVEHYRVHFRADAGYLLSLPCPESAEGKALPFKIARNGFQGAVHIAQQKPSPDGSALWLIGKCGGCGAKWRYEDWSDAEAVVVAIRSEADRIRPDTDSRIAWLHTVADRIAAGYGQTSTAIVNAPEIGCERHV